MSGNENTNTNPTLNHIILKLERSGNENTNTSPTLNHIYREGRRSSDGGGGGWECEWVSDQHKPHTKPHIVEVEVGLIHCLGV